jgi:hypothetical protein
MMQLLRHRSLVPPFFQTLESRQLLTVTASLVPVAISAAAVAKDPALANYKTYDLQVSLSKGERWLSTDAKLVLTKGSVYESNTADAQYAQSNLWSVFPQLEFDTFVSASDFQKPVILGSFDPATQTPKFSSNEVNVTWGALGDSGSGTFTVGRFTVSNDAVATLAGQTASSLTANAKPVKFNFTIGSASASLSSISGTVYRDADDDGKKDSSEFGMSGVKVYYDKNNNGKFDSGEKYRMSDTKGNYLFESLTAGTYRIREVLPSGYRRTQPSSGVYTCVLKSGINGTDKNFGNANNVTVSGSVFGDKDKDGHRDSNEIGQAGWTIWIDKDNDSKLDSGETSTTSDSKGNWSFSNLSAGSFHIRIKNQAKYKITTASSSNFSLSGGQTKSGILFGIRKVT